MVCASSFQEGKTMATSLTMTTMSAQRVNALTRWLCGLAAAATPAEEATDSEINSNWLAERRALRARASALAERPPLPSH
jgi:hypothetical protein